ncbi:unnamed protein product [Heligmosomoides polygyrus]|uniref:Col_cuticle_N domain-containing protein n=1 Tax=Heligmosomoides polygyrus TaxID=6339 RepID=A0A183FSZ3_HELPZ|nr:unnamed protein product [Heligmosomoides polygyrus]
MKVYAVTFVASSLSGIVLMCCLLAICQIYGNVQEFWRELDEEMSTIRSQTDQMWKDLVHIGATRRRRDVYSAGPAGPAGHVGSGTAGYVGISAPAHGFGEKGADGRKPIGRPGPKGQRGAQGDVGPQGSPGVSAGPGAPGPVGPHGGAGPIGPHGVEGGPGPEGATGRPGRDAEYCPCPARGFRGQHGKKV